MTEKLSKLKEEDNEITDPRAKAVNFVSQLDVVIEFALNLMNNIKEN